MFFDKLKINQELKNHFDKLYDFYIQDKNNSILETLLKINELLDNLVEKKQLEPELREVYAFTMQMLGDYYISVLDGHKGVRFFKEKIVKLRQQQLNDNDIIFNIYIKAGEFYVETGNKSKASECLSLCSTFAKSKESGYGLKHIEYLNSLLLLLLDQRKNAAKNLVKLLNSFEETDITDYYFKDRIIEKIKKILTSEEEIKEILTPILKARMKYNFTKAMEYAEARHCHSALILLKYAAKDAFELEKFDEFKEPVQKIYYEQAKLFFQFGFHKIAKELLEKAIHLITDKTDKNLILNLKLLLTQVFQYMKNYSSALQIVESIEQLIYNSAEYKIKYMFEKALCRSKFGNDIEALNIFLEIETHFLTSISDVKLANTYRVKINNEKAFILTKNYEFKQALDMYQNSVEYTKKNPDSDEHGETIRGVACALSTKDNNEHSLKLMRESLTIFEKNHNINQKIATMKHISKYYIRTGDINESLYYIDECVKLLEIREDFQELPLFYSQKAKIFLMQDNFQKAEEFFKKDLNITKQTDNIHSLAFSYYHLGMTYQKQNLYRIAETHLKKSLEYFNIVDNLNNKIPVLLLLAINNAKLGIPKLVNRYILDSEESWKITRDRIIQAKISLVKGITSSLLGKYGESIEGFYRMSAKLLNNIDPQHFDLIEVYQEFATYYQKTANVREASNNLKKAIELCQKIGLEEKVSSLLKQLTDISALESQKYQLKTLTGTDSSEQEEDMFNVIQRYLVVFFIDIRGFTTLSEQLEISKLQILLNDFYTSVTKVINQNSGMINKFIGDSVLALFNAQSDDPNCEEAAVKAGKEIIARLDNINQRRAKTGEPPINVGIGINAGNAMLGSFGSIQRRDYTAIGDGVNAAARLQSLAEKGEILITESVYQKVKDKFKIEFFKETQVKGKTEFIRIYKVL